MENNNNNNEKMDNVEKAELLRSKTGVTYERAWAALKANDYDVLESLVYLEKLGEINGDNIAKYTTTGSKSSKEFENAQKSYEKSCKSSSFGETMKKLGEWFVDLIKKGCDTTFEVTKGDKKFVAVPVIVLVIGILFAFWVVIPLLVVGLFFDCRYKFIGFEKTSFDINDVCSKASDTAATIKNDFAKEVNANKEKSENKDENK